MKLNTKVGLTLWAIIAGLLSLALESIEARSTGPASRAGIVTSH